MFAIDTNVLVRLIAEDDARQVERARKILESEIIFVPSSVLLETEWVLRSGLGLTKTEALQALVQIVGLPNVEVEDANVVDQAIDWATSGMDFADALHLAKAAGCEAFISFDKRMKKAADRLGLSVREP